MRFSVMVKGKNSMKFLSILKNKEMKNAGWIIAGRIAQMVLSFLISIFTARYLGPSNFGIINYAGAYVAFFTSLCTLGINSVIIKEFIDHPDEQGNTVGTTIVLRAVSSLLSSITILGIVSAVDRGELVTIAVSGLCSIALVFRIFDTINYWFQSKYQSKVTAIAGLAAYIVTSLYKIILLVLQKSVVWFAFANTVDYMIIAVFLFQAYRKYEGPKLQFSWQKGKYLLSKSYHYILSGMMVAIYGQTDKLMLKQMLDETAVGYYSLAVAINNMWVFVLQAVIDSISPTIISLYKSRNADAFKRKNRQLYAIIIYASLFVAIVFSFFGRYAIALLYGTEYAPASKLLKIIAWYTTFSYLGVARDAWIVCTDNQKYLKHMYFSAAVVNVLLNLCFIPIWGATGAAVASLATQILTGIILPCFIRQMRPNVKLMVEAFLLKNIR